MIDILDAPILESSSNASLIFILDFILIHPSTTKCLTQEFQLSNLDLLDNSIPAETFESALMKLLGEIIACSAIIYHAKTSDILDDHLVPLQLFLDRGILHGY